MHNCVQLHPGVVVIAKRNKDSRRTPGQRLRRNSRIDQRGPSHLKHHSLLRINAFGFAGCDTEEFGVELIYFLEISPRRSSGGRSGLSRHRVRGISRIVPRPSESNFQNCFGFSIPFGRRHAMPTIAIGSESRSPRSPDCARILFTASAIFTAERGLRVSSLMRAAVCFNQFTKRFTSESSLIAVEETSPGTATMPSSAGTPRQIPIFQAEAYRIGGHWDS